MNKKHTVIAALLLAAIVMLPISASAAQGTLSVPVSGTAVQSGTSVPIAGTFNITNFAVQNGQLVASGTLNFLLNGVQQVIQTAATVTNATGTCPVLNLSIGAIHLDVLGLVVDLAPVNLKITAQSGPGNLLGNLLCQVAALLDNNGGFLSLGTGLLNQLSTLLNQILAQL